MEKNRAVVEMKMDGKRPRGRPRLRWIKGTRKRGTSVRNGPLTRRYGPATPHRETAANVENSEKICSRQTL